jgi:hypothetical protein
VLISVTNLLTGFSPRLDRLSSLIGLFFEATFLFEILASLLSLLFSDLQVIIFFFCANINFVKVNYALFKLFVVSKVFKAVEDSFAKLRFFFFLLFDDCC